MARKSFGQGLTSSVDTGSVMKGANLGAGKGGSELNRLSTRTDSQYGSAKSSGLPSSFGGPASGAPGEINLVGYFQYPTYQPFIEEGLGFRPGWFDDVLATIGFEDPNADGQIGPDIPMNAAA